MYYERCIVVLQSIFDSQVGVGLWGRARLVGVSRCTDKKRLCDGGFLKGKRATGMTEPGAVVVGEDGDESA